MMIDDKVYSNSHILNEIYPNFLMKKKCIQFNYRKIPFRVAGPSPALRCDAGNFLTHDKPLKVASRQLWSLGPQDISA